MATKADKPKKLGSSRGLRSKTRGIADWAEANPVIVVSAIERASITGGALRFGYSRDGGAYALGIYGDGDPYTEYLKPGDDLDAWLQEVVELFQNIYDDQMSVRGAKKQPPPGENGSE